MPGAADPEPVWNSLVLLGVTLTVAAAVWCALVSWHARRELPTALPIATAAWGLAGSSVLVLVGYLRGAIPGAIPFAAASGALLTVGFGGIAVSLADRSLRFRRRFLFALAEPALIAVAAATNPYLHLIAIDPATRGVAPLGLFHLVFSIAYIIAVAVLVARRIRSGRVTGRRATLAVLAVVAPVACGGASVVAVAAGDAEGVVGLAVLTATATFLGWLTSGALALLPVARSQVVNTIPDAVIVMDEDQAVITANPAAHRFADRLPAGTPLRDLLPGLPPLSPDHDMVFDLRVDRLGADFEIRLSTLRRTGGAAGWTLVARDVTEIRRQETSLREANAALRAQLEVIEALRRDLAEQAVRDPLTGLHNRRHLMDFLDRAAGEPGESTLAVIDVDHFKQVNDEWGHPAGDQVLRHLAGILSAGLGPADVLARYGGEEFVLVMCGYSLDEGHQRVDALRRRLANTPATVDGQPLTVTFSAGVADLSLDGALAAADRALYEAKRAGRNRVARARTALVR